VARIRGCLHKLRQIDANRQRAHHERLIAALHGGSLSTPESFQARCGEAHTTLTIHNAAVLDYGEVQESFPESAKGRSVSFERIVNGSPRGIPADETWAMEGSDANYKPHPGVFRRGLHGLRIGEDLRHATTHGL
jgi:hypothetical protein